MSTRICREDEFQEREKGRKIRSEKLEMKYGGRKGKFGLKIGIDKHRVGVRSIRSILPFRDPQICTSIRLFPAGGPKSPPSSFFGKRDSLAVDVVATPSAFVVSRRTRGNSISRGCDSSRKILLEFNPDAVFPSLASSLPFQ